MTELPPVDPHAQLAPEVRAIAERIATQRLTDAGILPTTAAVEASWRDHVEEAREQLRAGRGPMLT